MTTAPGGCRVPFSVLGTLLLLVAFTGAAQAEHGERPDPFIALADMDPAIAEQGAMAHELDAPTSIADARALITDALSALDSAPDCEPWQSLTRAYWELTARAASNGIAGTPLMQSWMVAGVHARILASEAAEKCSGGT